ncbi:MAG: tautomerase family protein [Curvibacter sp.]
MKLSPPAAPPVQDVLARELTGLTASILGKRAEVTALMIQELPATRWYIGAAPVQRATAWLEVSVTTGTNTAPQKAAFIDAAFAALQLHLGAGQPLAPASYVIVREVPASDWGYAGQTQWARQQARERQEPAQAK